MTNEQKIWNYLKSIGCTDAGAAGMMGNLKAESGLIPSRLEILCRKRLLEHTGVNWSDEEYTKAVDDGRITRAQFLNPLPNKKYGYGICQWTTTQRKSGLYDLAKSKGVSIGDLDTQLEYLGTELSKLFPSVLKVLKSAKTVREASDIVLKKFEAPADQSESVKATRAKYGQVYYDRYAGKEKIMTCTAKEFVAVAKKYIGYEEKESNANLDDFHANKGSANYTKFGKWYGMNPAQWCQMFVSYCAYEACGNSKSKGKELLCGGYSAYTPTGKSYFVNKKRWYTTPEVGDVVYFYYTNMGRVAHVGIVVSVNKSNKTFTTVEGNTSSTEYARNGGCVATHSYSYANVGGSNRVNGFGRPVFSGSSSSTSTSSSTLEKGSTGSAVKEMQKMLIACGYTCGTAGADGDFGDGTLAALKAFQKDASLTVDGLYGSASKTALTKEYADTEVVIRNAITWAITIAEDATHGYDQTNRWGPDYDCSSFVISAYESAGIKVKSAGATYTKNIETGFKKCGFKNVTSKVNLQTGKGAVIGDVFLKAGYHTALYLGNGKIAHASLNENGQITGGKTGDQASEIRIQQYFYDNWDTVLRYESTQESTSTVETANNISKGQKWLNDNYGELLKKACGGLLAVDGDYGTKTRNACLAVWKDVVNRKYGFSLTPSNTNFGDSCAKAAKKATIRKGASGTLPYILNMILYAKGYYTGDASATYSAKTKTAVVAFQKAKGLSTDSIVGAKTWTKLFN